MSHFRRIAALSIVFLFFGTVANAQNYTITIGPPAKQKVKPPVAVIEEDTDEDLESGWNWKMSNQEPQFFMVNPWQQMYFMPSVARPRVWTNPKMKMNIKIRHSH